MRDYRLRGKRLDNGEWVYGCLIYDNVQTRIVLDLTQYNSSHCDTKSVEVDPETVGQFTGLKDKNGKEIYEGDVVKSHHNNSIVQIKFGEFIDSDESGRDVFGNGFYFYKCRKKGIDKGEPFARDCNGQTNQYEIIGTIHDQKAEV